MKPSLDHYVGRPVVGITPGKGKSGQWCINLEGGVAIKNQDNKVDQPEISKGIPLIKVNGNVLTFGVVQNDGTINGQQIVTLTDKKFSIADPARGDDANPGASEESHLPDDPSADRVATKALGSSQSAPKTTKRRAKK